MRYVYECDNMHPGCEDRVEGESPEHVLAAVADHERDSHGIDQLADEDKAKIMESIRAE